MMQHSLSSLFGKFEALKAREQTIQFNFMRLNNHIQSLKKQHKDISSRILLLEEELEILELTLELFKHFIDKEITEDVNAIRDLQIEGLSEVFHDRDLRVKAEVDESRGKVTVNFLTITSSGGREFSGRVDSSFGGSIAVIQGVLFRVSMIFRRGLRPVLFLDETLRFVEKSYADRAVKLLQALSERLGLDILLVTHDEDVVSAAKRVYRISYVDGKAKLRQMK